MIAGRFGSRNSPTVRYAAFIPSFRFIADGGAGNFLGGQFWGGRAASLEEQAKGPFLNPLEMNNPDKSTVVSAVSAANYAGDFLAIFGANAFNKIDTAYDPFLFLDVSLNPDGLNFIDLGLGGVLDDTTRNGEFRVPTLRNIANTAPYMHNEIFNTLPEVINFYNRRDLDGVVPEVSENVNNVLNIGELGLTTGEIQDLITFLNTLSDV